MRKLIFLFGVAALTLGCRGAGMHTVAGESVRDDDSAGSVHAEHDAPPWQKGKTATELRMEQYGLVNIRQYIPAIVVELVYATPDNFVGEVMYDDLTEAYLIPAACRKLAAAQQSLREHDPGYTLIVYDAARPMSVQRRMWDVAVRTGKQYYVANPSKGGGLHNYGAAVDVSILDSEGNPLPMGTDYDFLGPESNIDREDDLVLSGKITVTEKENRQLLRRVMTGAGFRTVRSEWWHFNHCSREVAVRDLQLLDF